jgi:hypothetical protein
MDGSDIVWMIITLTSAKGQAPFQKFFAKNPPAAVIAET